MKKVFFQILFFLAFVPLVSASTLTHLGEVPKCYGYCEGYDANVNFTLNGSVNYTTYIAMPSFKSISQAFVSFYSSPLASSTLYYSVLNFSSLNSSSSNYTFSYKLTNSSRILTSSFYMKADGGGNQATSGIFIFNFSSASWKYVGNCMDFCVFNTGHTFSFSWSDDFVNSSNDVLLNYLFDGSPIFYGNTFNWTENSTLLYPENVSFYLNGNESFNHTVSVGSLNFTTSALDFSVDLLSLDLNGSSIDIPFTLVAYGNGTVKVAEFFIEYSPTVSGSGFLSLFDEVVSDIGGGASISQVLESWNPEVYQELVYSFKHLFDDTSPYVLGENFRNIFILLLEYIFRQPASLVRTGEVSDVSLY